jgi:hypothetical protein
VNAKIGCPATGVSRSVVNAIRAPSGEKSGRKSPPGSFVTFVAAVSACDVCGANGST